MLQRKATGGWQITVTRDVDEYAAAAILDAWTLVVPERDADVVKIILAPELLVDHAIGKPNVPVVVPVAGNIAPCI